MSKRQWIEPASSVAGYFPHPPLGGGGGWWPAPPALLPPSPPASANAGAVGQAQRGCEQQRGELALYAITPPIASKTLQQPTGRYQVSRS
jgi:hypothetical protein